MKLFPHNLSNNDTVKRFLFGSLQRNSTTKLLSLSAKDAFLSQNESRNGEIAENGARICHCVAQLESFCALNGSPPLGGKTAEFRQISSMDFHSDLGRMLYTIAILLMFSFVIFALMVRSISRSRSSAELDTLLDSMRFREELDIQLRQKHRLRKAKRKVTAWLCRGNGAKMWQSSPHILIPNNAIAVRNNSLQSTGSYIPEIVISTEHSIAPASAEGILRNIERQNSYTPSLSLIYDFSYDSRRNSQLFSSFEKEDNEQMQSGSSSAAAEASSLSPTSAGAKGANGDEIGAVPKRRGRHGTK